MLGVGCVRVGVQEWCLFSFCVLCCFFEYVVMKECWSESADHDINIRIVLLQAIIPSEPETPTCSVSACDIERASKFEMCCLHRSFYAVEIFIVSALVATASAIASWPGHQPEHFGSFDLAEAQATTASVHLVLYNRRMRGVVQAQKKYILEVLCIQIIQAHIFNNTSQQYSSNQK